MNIYMKEQILNMINITQSYENACKLAALQKDVIINKEEAKTLQKIEKATDRYIKELRKIIKE